MVTSDRPQRLIEAARLALIEGGGDFEMSDVAKRADVSTGLAYHHFGSKAGLLGAVVEDFYARWDHVLNETISDFENWKTRERARVEHTVKFLYDEPLSAVVLGPLSRSAEAEVREAQLQSQTHRLAHDNVRDGIRRGEVFTKLPVDVAVVGGLGGFFAVIEEALTEEPRRPAEELIEQLWLFICTVLDVR